MEGRAESSEVECAQTNGMEARAESSRARASRADEIRGRPLVAYFLPPHHHLHLHHYPTSLRIHSALALLIRPASRTDWARHKP